MPHPVAATGNCSWCGDRALLYNRTRDGSEMERPACRPCMERGCGVSVSTKSNGAAQEQHRKGSVWTDVENDPMCGSEHNHRVPLNFQAPQAVSSLMIAQCEPPESIVCSPAGRFPIAVCQVASNEILCRKRANGGVAMDGLGTGSMFQCGSIGPWGSVGAFDTGRSPHKRQRTSFSERS